MANTKKYISLDKLSLYDEKIKKVIADGDAATLASAKEYANSLATNYDAAGSAQTVQNNLDAEILRAKAAEEANTALINAIKDGTTLDSFADVEAEIAKYQLSGDYAVNGHKHTKADITDFAHNHEMGEINGLADELAKYQLAGSYSVEGHKHEIADVNGLVDALAGKETAGEAAKVQGNLEAYIESNNAAVALKADKTEVEALAGKVGTVAEGSTVVGMIEAVGGKANANAEDIEELQGKVEALIEGAYDDTEVRGLISDNAEAIEALEGTHATDKAALEAAIALKADKTALEAEVERATGVETGLNTRLLEVETFFKTAEGETLDTALDTLVEIQKYLDGEGEVADQMLLDIAANKKAIEDHVATDHDFAAADATLKSELEGKIALKADASVVEAMDTAYKAADTEIKGRLDVLEAIDHEAYIAADTALENKLNAEIAKKADITALNAAVEALEGVDAGQEARIAALEGKVDVEKVSTAIESAIAAQDFSGFTTDAEHEELAGKVTVAEGKITTLEGKVDVEKVSTAIATAKQEAIDDAAAKANAAEAAAKEHANGLNTAMDARVQVVEGKAHEHANKAELDLIVTGDKAKWDEAAGKAHEHANKTVLDGITAAKVAAWDAAEQAAKTFAQDLNDAMNTRMIAVETWQANMVECSETDINDLFA